MDNSEANRPNPSSSLVDYVIKNFVTKRLSSDGCVNIVLPLAAGYLVLVLTNVILFHPDKLLFNLFLLCLLFAGFIYYNIKSQQLKSDLELFMSKSRRPNIHSTGFFKIDQSIESELNDAELNNSTTSLDKNNKRMFDPKSLLNLKPTLTDSYLVDDELHKIIELVIKDFVEVWYRANISDKEDFPQSVRILIYNSIRQINQCLKTIDWEHFITNILGQNLLMQVRMFKRAKEKVIRSPTNSATINNILSQASVQLASFKSLHSSNYVTNESIFATVRSVYNTQDATLVDTFFELESDHEKTICRDCISSTSSEREKEVLQEISETLCYSLLSTKSFNCLLFRCLIREILANHLMKNMIDKVAEPDYINQSILYLLQDEDPVTENFLTTITNTDSIDELNEIRRRIDHEIIKTRSNDKGGQNDQEIKQTLSSLFFVRKRIDIQITHIIKSLNNRQNQLIGSPKLTHSNSSSSGLSLISNSFDDEYKQYLFFSHLSSLEFDLIIKNESIQHCFIEFMGKKNVQNLVSFYLNTEMYRKFAIKELAKTKSSTTSETTTTVDIKEIRQMLRDFAQGLVHSYLLNAMNFISPNDDDEPANVVNKAYYKKELAQVIERMENLSEVDETLLDELQFKIYLLMKQKYYPDFKNYPEFHKILLKNDLIFKLGTSANSISLAAENNNVIKLDEFETAYLIDSSSTSSNATSSSTIFDSLETIDENNMDSISTSSFDLITADERRTSSPLLESVNPKNIQLTAVITSSGRCNEMNTIYAIYIIDVSKKCLVTNTVESWQTYRRFNDFHDLHLLLKKKFPSFSNLTLPGKSLRSSLKDDFLEKRRIELNKYLQTLTNPDTLANNPLLVHVLLKFLENKRWENKNNNIKRKFDSLLSPVISSVQNIQTSIKNAPDNMIDMFKGLSDNLMPTTPGPESSYQALSQYANGSNTRPRANTTSITSTSTPMLQSAQNSIPYLDLSVRRESNVSPPVRSNNPVKDLISMDEISANNLPIKVIILMIDEVFDLKEKNQWFRQSLMTIVKSFVKNFKGDSMNRKIKDKIADYLGQESVAHYLKNFRKRLWPKGVLATEQPERTKSDKEITKLLVKTKLIGLVSDELRHLLGTDTTRSGLFSIFDMLQHKSMNKRFMYILIEYFLQSFFIQHSENVNAMSLMVAVQQQISSPSQLNAPPSPLVNLIRLHLSKSSKVRAEWRLNTAMRKSVSESVSISERLNSPLTERKKIASQVGQQAITGGVAFKHSQSVVAANKLDDKEAKKKNAVPKSKSFYSEVNC